MKNKNNLQIIQQKLDTMQGGEARMKAILEAIKVADEAKEPYYQMLFRYEYAYEATFHDDPPKAMPSAVEFSSIFEENPDVLGPDGREMYLMIMQMAIDPVLYLPQIPLSQWEGMMEQFYSLVKRFNLGHRIYWWQMCRFMQYIDKNKAFEYFQKFWKTGRDALSDCRACERCYAVRMYLLMGDEAGAEEHAKPIKSRHIRFCGDAPHLMLLAYIEYAMDKGNLKMAIPYARELKRIGHRDRSDLSYIGAVLRCYAYSDLESGIELMANSFAWIVGMWDQKKMYDFYKGAWTIFHQLSKQQEEIHLALPKTIGCYQASGIYNIKEMEQWVYAQAEQIAQQFDARNQTDAFAKDLRLAVKEPRILM